MNTSIKSKSQERRLTTTSFAVLSVLSLRDHSTYDLIRQMRLSMHFMWPRAESNVYAEPSRLVAAGLATAREEWNGRRRRTVYSISGDGRVTLAQWLASPSAPQRYECEALVKVLFAENGSREELLASIRALGEDAADIMRHFLWIADRYASNEGDYPWRFGLSGLAARLLMEQQAATLRWAKWAEQVAANWETPLSEDAAWGVETLRATGEPLPLNEDPVRQIVGSAFPGDAHGRDGGLSDAPSAEGKRRTPYRVSGEPSHASQPRSPSTSKRRMRRMTQDREGSR